MSYLHHSSSLAWKIPWMEEPGRLQSTGSLRVGHDWATSVHFSLSCIGEGNGNPLQCSCLENRRDGGAWWAAVCGVAQSRTRLKWLSSSSRSLRHYSLFLKHFSLCSSDWMDSVDLYQVHSFTIPNLLLNCYSQLFITVTLSNSRISVSFFFF